MLRLRSIRATAIMLLVILMVATASGGRVSTQEVEDEAVQYVEDDAGQDLDDEVHDLEDGSGQSVEDGSGCEGDVPDEFIWESLTFEDCGKNY